MQNQILLLVCLHVYKITFKKKEEEKIGFFLEENVSHNHQEQGGIPYGAPLSLLIYSRFSESLEPSSIECSIFIIMSI